MSEGGQQPHDQMSQGYAPDSQPHPAVSGAMSGGRGSGGGGGGGGGGQQQGEDMQLNLQATLMQGLKNMQHFMMEMKSRMDRLEDNVDKVQGAVGSVLQHVPYGGGGGVGVGVGVGAQQDLRFAGAMQVPPQREPTALMLHLASDMETMWYTDRPFPPFVVEVRDETGAVYTKADDWEIVIHLLDGYGRYVDDKLGQNERARHVLTHRGRATIAGLRFYAVSSKNGGSFSLEFELKSPPVMSLRVPTLQSNPITILSCRLFHNPKAPLSRLRPDDSLSKMPGIGKLYAQRFCAVGVDTIAKLAAIDLNNMDPHEQQSFLESLRKDKGTMTKGKLEEYIAQAREVMERIPPQREGSRAKRRKIDHSSQLPKIPMLPPSSGLAGGPEDPSMGDLQVIPMPSGGPHHVNVPHPSLGPNANPGGGGDPGNAPRLQSIPIPGLPNPGGEGDGGGDGVARAALAMGAVPSSMAMGSGGGGDGSDGGDGMHDWGMKGGGGDGSRRSSISGMFDEFELGTAGALDFVPQTRERRASSVSKYFAPALLANDDDAGSPASAGSGGGGGGGGSGGSSGGGSGKGERRGRSNSVTNVDVNAVIGAQQ